MRSCSATPLRLGIVCLALVLGPAATRTSAQSVLLRGVITDAAGAPIEGADVRVIDMPFLATTDEKGEFAFRFLPPGPVVLSVRRVGFLPLEIGALAPSDGAINLVMRAHPARLSSVEVSASATRRRMGIEGFYERRERGIGRFVTREDILARLSASRPTDMLRNMPGIRVVRVDGVSGIRFISSAVVRRDCMPMMWVDGQRAPGMEIDHVSLNDIEGIELYHGPSTTPMQFSYGPSGTTCGTIVLWTRNPGS